MFGSSRIGLLLYLTHVAASVLVGLLFRLIAPGTRTSRSSRPAAVSIQTVRFAPAFIHSIKTAAQSIVNICAFVVFFSVVIRLLFLCGAMDALAHTLTPLGLNLDSARKLITGLLELSSGVTSLSPADPITGQASLAAFLLGWAGLSVHCQVLSFMADSDLRITPYLLGKLLHGGLSALLMWLLTRLFPLSRPVSSYLTQQVDAMAQLDFSRALSICSTAAWTLWLFFLAVTVCMMTRCKKRSGNVR